MKKLFHHLNTKLAVIAGCVLLLLLSLTLFFLSKIFYSATHDLHDDLTKDITAIYSEGYDEQLIDLAGFLGGKLFTSTYNLDMSALNSQINQISLWLQAKSILITDRDGLVLTDGTIENSSYGNQLFFPSDLMEKEIVLGESAEGYRQIFFTISSNEQVTGFGVITLGLEQRFALLTALNKNIDKAVDMFKQRFNLFAVVSIFFILLCCFSLAIWLYRSLSLPLLNMIKAAEAFSIGNYNYELPAFLRNHSEIGRLAVALNKMASDIQEAEEKIVYQAHFDSLTSLPNRFLILDRLKQYLADADRTETKVALMFLDLDGFKKINDTLGHDIGDQLLVEASKRITHVIREGDSVGRLGGDEFIVLVKGFSHIEDTQACAENIHHAFKGIFKLGGRELNVTTSIGIAIYPENGTNSSELLINADSAMYHAKAQGKNTYAYFSDEMNAKVSRHLQLEEQLAGALSRQEFSVVYQPKINVISNKIMGAEALLRWNNPELGFVSPEEFIPVLEQTTLIAEVGSFVIDEALQQTKKWQDDFDNTFKIAINISPRQFRISNLPELMMQLLDEHSVAASTVELEITEGVLMEAHNRVTDVLDTLNDMEINLAMDDFGKGYSSLSYLRKFPFDVVKIDRGFVNDITTDPADRELVSAAIAMAHGLNLTVVAEGVETQEQLSFLTQHKCDLVQGYLFSKPVDPEAFTSLLEQQRGKMKEKLLAPINI